MSDPFDDVTADAFASPSNAFRPRWRWWWNSSFDAAEAEREIQAMIKAGFAGAEITWHPDLWANQEQRQALQDTLRIARQSGFEIDMTLAARWPINSPATGPETGLAQLELQYGRTDVTGRATFTGRAPTPIDDPDNQRAAELVAVTAARVIDRGPPVQPPESSSGPAIPPSPGNMGPPSRSTTLDPDSLIDLTEHVTDRTLTWTPPDGDWIVFGFWSRPLLQRDGSLISLFDADSVGAATAYVDEHQLGPENAALLREVSGSFFEDSLEYNAQSLFWSRDLLNEFADRRGYPLAPVLPLLFVQGMSRYWVPVDLPVPDFALPDHAAERIRADYRRLLDDLHAEKHLGVFAAWAAGHQRRFRVQPAYGQNLNVTRAAREAVRAGGLVEDETLNAGGWGSPPETLPYDIHGTHWRFAMDHYRSVAGGSHQAGQNAVTSELGASGHPYALTLTDYKTLMDNQWAAGLTTPIPHGFAFQLPDDPWPGTSWFPVSEAWHDRTYPEWSMLRPLADYWARGSCVLQAGIARVDVAVLYDGFLTTAARPSEAQDTAPQPLFDALSLEERGFRLEYVDSVGLAEPQARGDGTLYPDGPRYRALVIAQDSLPPDTAEAIAEQAVHGLVVVVVGPPPVLAATYADAELADRRVAAAMERLLTSPTAIRVAQADQVGAALSSLGLRPDVSWSPTAQVYTQHRETATSDYFYLYNPTSEPITFEPTFAVIGVPRRMDLWTGHISPIAQYREEAGTVSIPLHLLPGENVVLEFTRNESPAVHVVDTDAETVMAHGDGSFEVRGTRSSAPYVRLSTGAEVSVQLPEPDEPLELIPWRLSVIEAGPEPEPATHVMDLAELDDWRNLTGLEHASGFGTYTATIDVPKARTGLGRGCYLALGRVDGGSVQVRVNDQLAHPAPVVLPRIDITDLLVEGPNTIEVTFASTLLNRVGFSGRSQPYGLRGPVRLVPFTRVTVAAPTT